MRPVIFVSGPYNANNHQAKKVNIQKAHQVAATLWEMGWAAFCPHTHTAHMDEYAREVDFIDFNLMIMRMCCDAVFMIPGWEASRGATQEHSYAKECALPICYSFEEARERLEWVLLLRG